jgi:hypothetical protein
VLLDDLVADASATFVQSGYRAGEAYDRTWKFFE